uniref:FHF complex subunit HOOK-interacting protein C-terminal domain-containing protein n=1 Tax=Rhodnius prolixus TaxID=13249 RepID=T1I3S9_RHOPR
MSWLRNASLGGNYVKHRVISSNNKDFDPEACYESFRKHWQQIDDIINNTTGSPGGVKYDDMKAVVYNLEHMNDFNKIGLDNNHSNFRYENALKSEQLRLHEKVIEELGVERNHWSEGQRKFAFMYGTFKKARPHCRDHCTVFGYLPELNGLYSNLPRRLDIDAVDWYRLTPDDVNELPPLAAFMNSLDFCNAVVRKAHPLVIEDVAVLKWSIKHKKFMSNLDLNFKIGQAKKYMTWPASRLSYREVKGLSLAQDHQFIQISAKFKFYPLDKATVEMSAVYELTTATSYFDAFIRSISEPGLIFCFVKFILTEDYDGQCIIDILIERIHSNSKLCLVTLALLETLVDLNCEDIMLELVFKYLISCNHVMASQRSKINFRDPFCKNAEIFLLLAPNIQRNRRREGSLYGDYHAYLSDARTKIDRCAAATSTWIYKYDGENPPYSEADRSHQSLQSVDETSSGYESIARTGEDLIYSDSDSPRSSDCPLASIKQINSAHSAIIVGPFLQAVLDKLENMLSQHFFINLHLTGLISRLAIYSQPLLRSFLLDESLIFQPSIRSLFQVLRSLKHKIESKLKEISSNQLINLINESESLLLERENKVVNVRKYALLHSIRSTLTSNEDSVTNGRLPEK